MVVSGPDDLLEVVPLFRSLAAADRGDLGQRMVRERVPAGRMLMRYGDPGDSMFVVCSGTAEVFIDNATGDRFVLEVAGPGAVLGEVALLHGGARSASVLARE